MIERGVRFVQLYSGGVDGWDAHKDVEQNHGQLCRRTDKPIAGLLEDLKRRGLWNDTLVIWGGEFGRMPMSESGSGRDHNPWGYTMWLAGGGVRPGMTYGATDPVGLRATENKVHIHDLHATILHLLGLDHEALTFPHNGREERLTDVAGRVIQGMELLSGLPRGPAPMGFYADPARRVPILSLRLAADLPQDQRAQVEVLRTDSPTFAALVEARRNRRDAFYRQPAGKIDLCSITVPVREAHRAPPPGG